MKTTPQNANGLCKKVFSLKILNFLLNNSITFYKKKYKISQTIKYQKLKTQHSPTLHTTGSEISHLI